MITDRYRLLHAEWLLGSESQDAPDDYSDPDPPLYIAAGVGLAGASPETLLALVSEMARVPISTKEVRELTGSVVKYISEFPKGIATGAWKEIGLFTADEAAVLINDCDSMGTAGTAPGTAAGTAVWSCGDNIGGLELTDRREGSAAVEAYGTAPNPRFHSSTLQVSAGECTTSAWLQLFYYVDDVDSLDGTLEIRIGNDDSNYWQFDTAHGSIVEGWQWLSFQISDYNSKVGNPVFSSLINYFRLDYSESLLASLLDRIDFIRLFTENGDMYARGEISAGEPKGLNEDRHVIWELRVLGSG